MEMTKKIKILKNKRKAKEITKTILSICLSGVATYIASGSVRSPAKLGRMWGGLGKYSATRVRECLKRLKIQNYINYDEDDLTKPIFITEKGLQRYSALTLKEKIRNLTMKKWDHIWRLVTFDVDEKNRRKRDVFRRHLRRIGFYKLQQNIYVLPYPLEKEVADLINSCHMWNDAVVLHVADLGKKEKEIKEYFLFKK